MSPGPRLGPVNVCFIIDRLSRAGTETQLLALIRHLDRDRVRPTLCLLNGTDQESQSLLPTDCPTLELRLRRLASLTSPAAALRLTAFWRRNRVSVVQTYFLDSSYFAVPLARACGIPHVIQVRNNSGYWLTPAHRRIGRIIGRLAHYTLTNSNDARRAVVETQGVTHDRVHVIKNGVDLERFATLPPPNTSRPLVRVGTVANLRQVKNIDGLIRVAADICRNDSRVRFEVAGDGEQRLELETQVRAAGLGDRFTLRGSVSNVPGFLGSLDVAVLPSHSESMSNALLEYMAAGRAIVATDVGANADVVRDELEGLIVPSRNNGAMESAINRLLNDPPLARRLGAAAKIRAEREYSRLSMVRRFEDFYDSLSGARPAIDPRAGAREEVDS